MSSSLENVQDSWTSDALDKLSSSKYLLSLGNADNNHFQLCNFKKLTSSNSHSQFHFQLAYTRCLLYNFIPPHTHTRHPWSGGVYVCLRFSIITLPTEPWKKNGKKRCPHAIFVLACPLTRVTSVHAVLFSVRPASTVHTVPALIGCPL